ncbi:MAG: hypothetical protein WA982_09935 [Rubrobacteraceae bacterium]
MLASGILLAGPQRDSRKRFPQKKEISPEERDFPRRKRFPQKKEISPEERDFPRRKRFPQNTIYLSAGYTGGPFSHLYSVKALRHRQLICYAQALRRTTPGKPDTSITTEAPVMYFYTFVRVEYGFDVP